MTDRLILSSSCNKLGTLEVQAIYCLKDDNSLIFDFRATTDALTPVNLTNVSTLYWHLHQTTTTIWTLGFALQSVSNSSLCSIWLLAYILEPARRQWWHSGEEDSGPRADLECGQVPPSRRDPDPNRRAAICDCICFLIILMTMELIKWNWRTNNNNTKGTPMDFVSQPHTIGERIGKVDLAEKGYDHCYVLNKNGETLSVDIQGQPREKLTLAAVVVDRDSQRKVNRYLPLHDSHIGVPSSIQPFVIASDGGVDRPTGCPIVHRKLLGRGSRRWRQHLRRSHRVLSRNTSSLRLASSS